MKTIIAIVGPSGSGKTHLTKFLQKELNIPTIVSYTTRPARVNEKNGIEHFFLDNQASLPPMEKMLAYTHFGGYDYFALHSQVPDTVCTYVIDEKGLEELSLQHCDKYQIIAVAIKCSEETLVRRGIDPKRIHRDRERKHLSPEYFDSIILNNGSIEEFEYQILCKINTL
ncbi:guanylate kinase [Bacteroides fragilis]|nr:guanylate kinase [Bacteroides fragilis]